MENGNPYLLVTLIREKTQADEITNQPLNLLITQTEICQSAEARYMFVIKWLNNYLVHTFEVVVVIDLTDGGLA